MTALETRSCRVVPLLAAVCLLGLGLGLGAGTGAARADTGGLPSSMAAIGDSLTQATNAGLLHFGASNPGLSWATGDNATDAIVSHYERILTRSPGIAGRNGNLAVSGAKMADAPDQAARAVPLGADYVTVLMGANDVCAASRQAMTPVAAFESSFRLTMTTLTAGLPAARILVGSIPDIHQLWTLYRGNLLARLTWEWFKICPTMLAGATTEADRQFARARTIDLNTVLRTVCAEFTQCRFDDGRVFDHRLAAAEVSIVDFFHPSVVGLRNLAETMWQAGFWPEV